MYPDSGNNKWILQAAQTGLPSTVNEQRPTFVTSNQFALFSEDLSVTTAGNTRNQAPAVITPTHQEQAQQPNQHQLQEEEEDNNNNGNLSDQQHQQEGAGNKDKIDELQEELESTRTNVDELYKNQKDIAAVATQRTTQPATDDTKLTAEVDTDKLVRNVVAALAKQECFMAKGKTTKEPTHTIDKLWRQWKHYCYTCGCNLTHPTHKCTRKCKWDGNDEHLDTTYADP